LNEQYVAPAGGRQQDDRVFVLLLGAALGLAACTTLPPPPVAQHPAVLQRDRPQAFALAGRFTLRHAGKSYAGRLDWRHDGEHNELLLSSPLGQTMAEITSDADGAQLRTSDGSTRTAVNIDQLLQSVLDYPLSLNQLLDWLRGRNPDGGRLELDPLGRPLRLLHEDWRVDYAYDSEQTQALPGRLFVEREGGFVLRLRIEEWQPLPAPEAP